MTDGPFCYACIIFICILNDQLQYVTWVDQLQVKEDEFAVRLNYLHYTKRTCKELKKGSSIHCRDAMLLENENLSLSLSLSLSLLIRSGCVTQWSLFTIQ